MKQIAIEYRRTDQQTAIDVYNVTNEEANRVMANLEHRQRLASNFLIIAAEDGRFGIYNPAVINAALIVTVHDNEATVSEGQGQKPTKAGRKKGS